MNFLLDTHTFIWVISDSKKLSNSVKKILEDNGNSIYVSAITYWEIALKVSTGKLESFGVSLKDLPDISLQIGFINIPILPTQCATYNQLEATWHKDPFDRMLIWQAIQQNLTLITKDEDVIKYSSVGLKTTW